MKLFWGIVNKDNDNLLELTLTRINSITNDCFMFYHCGSLKQTPDINKWDNKNVTNMNSMFSKCTT